MARRIVEMTDGLLTLSDIYAAPTNDPEAGNG
jgi:hypothetical protein